MPVCRSGFKEKKYQHVLLVTSRFIYRAYVKVLHVKNKCMLDKCEGMDFH